MTLHLKPSLGVPVSLVRGSDRVEGKGEQGEQRKEADGGDGGVDLEIAGEDMEEALQ